MTASRLAPPLLTFGLLLLTGCNRTPARAEHKVAASPEAIRLNDTACFLAGLSGRPGSPFQPLEASPSWRSYSAEVSQMWEQAQRDQFDAVDVFQKRELARAQSNSSFVFYPFSGPDILYALHFFPNGKTYVLAGLENVGTMKTASEYSQTNLDRELNGWRQAVGSIFNRSFFVTSEMDSEFHGRVANGLLPMILLLLVRSGNTIDGLEYGHLDDTGAFLRDPQPLPVKDRGARIWFRGVGGTSSRTLYYFSTNLSNDFEAHPRFLHFLEQEGRADTLVKSASFLLHWKMCNGLRGYILKSSNLILEDDTGVPYRFFENADWQVRLFGGYSRPDRPFRREYQPDLASAFDDRSKVHELGFSLGYGYGRRPSSMILAERIKQPSKGS